MHKLNSRIFICYRRADSQGSTGRLADDLRQYFSRERVFQDISSIDPGADFTVILDRALQEAAAVLVQSLNKVPGFERKRTGTPVYAVIAIVLLGLLGWGGVQLVGPLMHNSSQTTKKPAVTVETTAAKVDGLLADAQAAFDQEQFERALLYLDDSHLQTRLGFPILGVTCNYSVSI